MKVNTKGRLEQKKEVRKTSVTYGRRKGAPQSLCSSNGGSIHLPENGYLLYICWKCGWVNGEMGEQVGGWMGEWMSGCVDGWMHGWMSGWIDEWMGGGMEGWMHEWISGWVDMRNGKVDEWTICGEHIHLCPKWVTS